MLVLLAALRASICRALAPQHQQQKQQQQQQQAGMPAVQQLLSCRILQRCGRSPALKK
jgi:hypothetical protein